MSDTSDFLDLMNLQDGGGPAVYLIQEDFKRLLQLAKTQPISERIIALLNITEEAREACLEAMSTSGPLVDLIKLRSELELSFKDCRELLHQEIKNFFEVSNSSEGY